MSWLGKLWEGEFGGDWEETNIIMKIFLPFFACMCFPSDP